MRTMRALVVGGIIEAHFVMHTAVNQSFNNESKFPPLDISDLLLAGTNFSVLVVGCIWQVLIFLRSPLIQGGWEILIEVTGDGKTY